MLCRAPGLGALRRSVPGKWNGSSNNSAPVRFAGRTRTAAEPAGELIDVRYRFTGTSRRSSRSLATSVDASRRPMELFDVRYRFAGTSRRTSAPRAARDGDPVPVPVAVGERVQRAEHRVNPVPQWAGRRPPAAGRVEPRSSRRRPPTTRRPPPSARRSSPDCDGDRRPHRGAHTRPCTTLDLPKTAGRRPPPGERPKKSPRDGLRR